MLTQRRRIQTAEQQFRRSRLASGSSVRRPESQEYNSTSMFQNNQSVVDTICKTNVVQDKIERLKLRHGQLQQQIHQQQNDINKINRQITEQQHDNSKYNVDLIEKQVYKKQEKLNDLTCKNADLQQQIRETFQIEKDFKDQVMLQNNQINQYLSVIQNLMDQNQELFMKKEDLSQDVQNLNQQLQQQIQADKQIIQEKQQKYDQYTKEQTKKRQNEQLKKLNQIDQMQAILDQQQKDLMNSYSDEDFNRLQHIYDALSQLPQYENYVNENQDIVQNIITFAKVYKQNQQSEGDMLNQLDILNKQLENLKMNKQIEEDSEKQIEDEEKGMLKELNDKIQNSADQRIKQIIDVNLLQEIINDQQYQDITDVNQLKTSQLSIQ